MIPSGFVSWLMNNMPWPKWLCFLVVCHDPSGFVFWLYAMTQVALFLGCMPWPKWLCSLVICHDPSAFISWLYAMKWLLFLEEPYHTPKGFVSCKGNAALTGRFYTTICSNPKINEDSGIISLFVYFYYASVITLNTSLFGFLVPLRIGGGWVWRIFPIF